MTKIKAIIFDLGKVVFDLSFDRVFESWVIASGKPFEEIKQRFAYDEIFEKFERNEVTPQRFREHVCQRLGIQLSDDVFDNGWCNLYLDKYEGIDAQLVHLKREYRLVALTNTNFIHSEVWKARYADTLMHFEKIFSSCEMSARKPDALAYKYVLDYLNLEPAETLFLDDNIENVYGATHLGIPAITVASFDQMKTELMQLLNPL